MADYKYTQQSGTNWKVNTSDKADAYEDTNEIRAVVDELGELLGHSLKDGSFPEDLAYDGTLAYVKKSNFTSTGSPTTGDDSIDGYAVGSRWINTATDAEYVCLDSSSGAAVWEETTVDTFLDLTDTPADFSGDANKILAVTTGEDAVEFVSSLELDNITLSSGGGQITFPASQNASTGANVLDDYEEGTWTMGISFGGGTTGITYSINTGYYTKIGNTVTISGFMTLTSKGTDNGIALVTGLPFTVVNNNAGIAAAALVLRNVTFANQSQGFANMNTTTITLEEVTEAGTLTSLTDADFANNSQIIVGCTYRVE